MSDLSPLVAGAYGLLLADPPWRFRTWGEHNQRKSASLHYNLMTTDQIRDLPVGGLAAANCVLVMWTIWTHIPQALDVMGAWGFAFKTGGVWAKQSSTGAKWAFSTGYLFRGACEPFLVGTIGKPKRVDRSIRNLIVAPVREHSRKPDLMHENLERLFPDARRAELFGRQSRPGWETFGNQATKFDEAVQ